MKKPYEGKPCPRDERIACKDCGWWIREGMGCKLGYIRKSVKPVKPPGKDQEYSTKW